ncbi:RICIN domain-containing protein [Nonomuraea sp. B5E05]|uniref:RICIN domain-containing protein n=1 Tax=Nonomuraea sp. B5E05 TaxID=3153569 RepID=UPI0032600908
MPRRAGQRCGTTRTTRAQKISFNSDGSPNLGVPVRTGTTIECPSGDSNASSPTVYRINVRHSGKAMDVQQPNTDNGARVGQYTYNGNAWQQWQFQDAGSGYFQLRARHSGKCVDVPAASTADGVILKQYPCNTGTNQQWSRKAI